MYGYQDDIQDQAEAETIVLNQLNSDDSDHKTSDTIQPNVFLKQIKSPTAQSQDKDDNCPVCMDSLGQYGNDHDAMLKNVGQFRFSLETNLNEFNQYNIDHSIKNLFIGYDTSQLELEFKKQVNDNNVNYWVGKTKCNHYQHMSCLQEMVVKTKKDKCAICRNNIQNFNK